MTRTPAAAACLAAAKNAKSAKSAKGVAKKPEAFMKTKSAAPKQHAAKAAGAAPKAQGRKATKMKAAPKAKATSTVDHPSPPSSQNDDEDDVADVGSCIKKKSLKRLVKAMRDKHPELAKMQGYKPFRWSKDALDILQVAAEQHIVDLHRGAISVRQDLHQNYFPPSSQVRGTPSGSPREGGGSSWRNPPPPASIGNHQEVGGSSSRHPVPLLGHALDYMEDLYADSLFEGCAFHSSDDEHMLREDNTLDDEESSRVLGSLAHVFARDKHVENEKHK
eukprot:g14202.t1